MIHFHEGVETLPSSAPDAHTHSYLSLFLLSMRTSNPPCFLTISLLGTEIVTAMELMITPAPTIYKPKMLWTGKQVVSSLLKHMCRPPLPQLNLGKECTLTPSLCDLPSFLPFFLSISPLKYLC